MVLRKKIPMLYREFNGLDMVKSLMEIDLKYGRKR